MKKNNTFKVKVKIDAQFGSEFQYMSATDSLVMILKGWRDFYNTSHKNNLINFAVETEKEKQ